MQLLTIEQHKRKTAHERESFNQPATIQNYQTIKSSNINSTRVDAKRTIYKGSRGGEYYINSKGNKTYVRKKK